MRLMHSWGWGEDPPIWVFLKERLLFAEVSDIRLKGNSMGACQGEQVDALIPFSFWGRREARFKVPLPVEEGFRVRGFPCHYDVRQIPHNTKFVVAL